jgi:hypothetical protein
MVPRSLPVGAAECCGCPIRRLTGTRDAAEALLKLAETQFVNGLGPVLRLDQACAPLP